MIVSDEFEDAEENVHDLFQYNPEMPRDGEESRWKLTQDNSSPDTDSIQNLPNTKPGL
jgi:hypothetical protein